MRRGRNPSWTACRATENEPEIAAWEAMMVAAVARKSIGYWAQSGNHQEEGVDRGARVVEDQDALAEVVEHQGGERDRKPAEPNRRGAEVTPVGVQGLGAGDGEHDAAERQESRRRRGRPGTERPRWATAPGGPPGPSAPGSSPRSPIATNQTRITGPNSHPIVPDPRRWRKNRATQDPDRKRHHEVSEAAASTTFRPWSEPRTEIAGVMIPSPKNSAAPKMPRVTSVATRVPPCYAGAARPAP